MRRPTVLLLVLALLAPACAGRRMPMNKGVAEPFGRDFLDFPEKYRGQTVRLFGLAAARIEITRPLVFTPPGRQQDEVVVSDGRSLASAQHLRQGEVVTILVACTEGRTDRGNLLLAIERAGPPASSPPAR